MSAVLLVPLLPLLAALIVLVGDEGSTASHGPRSRPIPSAPPFSAPLRLCGLWRRRGRSPFDSTTPLLSPSLAFPIGFYIDRLSAVMMVLISGVGTIIYTYSHRLYVSGSPRSTVSGAHRLHDLCVALHGLQRQPHDAVSVLASPELSALSPGPQSCPCGDAEGAFRTFTLLRVGDVAFLCRHCSRLSALRHIGVPRRSSPRPPNRPSRSRLCRASEISGATAVTLLLFIGAMSKSAQFPLHHLAAAIALSPRRRCMRCCTQGSSMPAAF